MRLAWIAVGLAVLVSASPAVARPRIVEKTEYYDIRGATGFALLQEMNRKGPRHGFLTKAIAQTRYTSAAHATMVHRNGICRAEESVVNLDITYIYPRPVQKLPRALERRWRGFMADNLRHEREHGRIARAMAVELDRHQRRFALKDGLSCNRAKAQLRREMKAIVDRHERAQIAFDEREHRDGGAVEKSILLLVGTP